MTTEITEETPTELAAKLLLASPPGEVNNVFNDLRTLVGDDVAFADGILPAIEQYNKEQLIVVQHEGSEVIISEAGQDNDDKTRFLDPRTKQTFKLHHLKLELSDPQVANIDESTEALRSALDDETRKYVEDHFRNGACAVYSHENKLTIVLVKNKYAPNNYWSGRWRATWKLDTQTGDLEGETKVNVHYYEDGNVQVDTSKTTNASISINEDAQKIAKSVVQEIKKADTAYHATINGSYDKLMETSKNVMRRALPVTGQKMNWLNPVKLNIHSDSPENKPDNV